MIFFFFNCTEELLHCVALSIALSQKYYTPRFLHKILSEQSVHNNRRIINKLLNR